MKMQKMAGILLEVHRSMKKSFKITYFVAPSDLLAKLFAKRCIHTLFSKTIIRNTPIKMIFVIFKTKIVEIRIFAL